MLVYDHTGSYNLFTITAVTDSTTLTVKKPADATRTTFAAGSKIVEASSHTYYLKTDVPANTYQLMHYDGTGNRDAPVVDNVGAHIRLLRRGAAADRAQIAVGCAGDHLRSGSRARSPVAAVGAFENCLFSPGAIRAEAARARRGTQALVALTAAQLTDGPFFVRTTPTRTAGTRICCGSGGSLSRWRPDRRAATARPGGRLFTRGGASAGGLKWVPDQELHFGHLAAQPQSRQVRTRD